MSHQIKPSVTNPTIADVYRQIVSGDLILRPEFQRKFVWTSEHQEEFIVTVLKGLPFPEIYVCEDSIDVELKRTIKAVIDGQQRLTTIRNYIDGVWSRTPVKHRTYSSLTNEEKQDFLGYQIVVRDLGKVDVETVREIFRRINLTKFKLDDVEIHNAIYDGEFIQTAKGILESASLEKFGVFKESEFTRMADLHFILLVMSTVENGGYFPQDREVEVIISRFNDHYPNSVSMKELLMKIFADLHTLDIPSDSMWFRKSNFFTLVVETAKHVGALPKDYADRLLRFEQLVMTNKADTSTEFALYYSYMYQATHGRQARVKRGELFSKHCIQ